MSDTREFWVFFDPLYGSGAGYCSLRGDESHIRLSRKVSANGTSRITPASRRRLSVWAEQAVAVGAAVVTPCISVPGWHCVIKGESQ